MQKLARDYLNELNKRHKKNRRALVAWILMAVLVVGGVMGTLAQYGFADDTVPTEARITEAAAQVNEDIGSDADVQNDGAGDEIQEPEGQPSLENTDDGAGDENGGENAGLTGEENNGDEQNGSSDAAGDVTSGSADGTSAPAGTEPAETGSEASTSTEQTGAAAESTTAATEMSSDATTGSAETSAEPTTETMETEMTSEAEDESEEVLSPEVNTTQKIDGSEAQIHVYAGEGVLPEGTQLSVKPIVKKTEEELERLSAEERKEAEAINATFDEVQKKLEASAEEKGQKELLHFEAFDISFLANDENGEPVEIHQPDGDVDVTIDFPDGSTVQAFSPEKALEGKAVDLNNVDIELVHMKETPEVLENAGIDGVKENKTDVSRVRFTSDSFSVYAITWMGDVTGFTYENEDVTISVTEEAEGAIPKHAELNVVPILKEGETQEKYFSVAEKLREKAEKEGYEIAGFLAYDISFVDREGTKTEPSGQVKVEIEYQNPSIPEEVNTEEYSVAAVSEEDATAVPEEEVAVVQPRMQTRALSGITAKALNGMAALNSTTLAAEEITEEEEEPAEKPQLDITVMHLEEDENGNVTNVVDMGAKGDANVESTENQEVKKTEFVTDSFSTFVITWTSNGKTQTITVHYVNENGYEIDGPQLKEISNNYGGTINLVDYAPSRTDGTFIKIELEDHTEINQIRKSDNQIQYYKGSWGANGEWRNISGGGWKNWFKTNESNIAKDIYIVYQGVPGSTTTSTFGTPAHRKYIQYNKDTNDYTLTLDVTGKRGATVGVDVLLVIDKSGSMGSGTGSLMGKTKTAVNNVVSKILPDDTSVNKMAVVSFSSYEYINPGWHYNNYDNGDISTPWVGYDEKTTVTNQVNGLSSMGGTNWQLAMQKAEEKLKEVSTDGNQKVVIFMSDGNPGYYFATENGYYWDQNRYHSYSKGDEIGTGSGYNATAFTMAVDEVANSTCLKEAKIYSVYLNDDTQSRMNSFANELKNNKGVDAEAADGRDMTKALNDIISKVITPVYTNVTIEDTLSDYADFVPGTQFEVYKKKGDESVLLVEKTENEKDGDYELTVDEGTKKITLSLLNGNALEEGAVYSISFRITPSAKAIQERNEGKEYLNIGEEGTDAPGNTTSSYKKGFYSNKDKEAIVKYRVNDGSESTAEYRKPVIQIDPSEGSDEPSLGEPAHSKKIKKNGDNSYTLSLDVKGEIGNSSAIDVLFIVDESGSMKDAVGETTRQKLVEDAISTFKTTLQDTDAVKNGDLVINAAAVMFSGPNSRGSETDVQNSLYSGGDARGEEWKKLEDLKLELNPVGGTNWQAGIRKGEEVLRGRSGNKKYVIFLTDGNPTLRYVTDANGNLKTQGNGASDSHNLSYNAAVLEWLRSTTLSSRNTVKYVIDTANASKTSDFAEAIGATYLDGTNSTDLEEKFQTIADGILRPAYTDVYIQDTLSEYVEFEGDNLADIHLQAYTIDKDGTETILGTDKYSVDFNSANKTIKINLLNGGRLEDGVTYRFEYDVVPTARAYADYQNSEYGNVLGDPGTDIVTENRTSSLLPGFHSNAEAIVGYTVKGIPGTDKYLHPVVQVGSVNHTVIKQWEGPALDSINVLLKASILKNDETEELTNYLPLPENMTQTLNADNKWTYTWQKLPKYYCEKNSSGKWEFFEITYTVEEILPDELKGMYEVTANDSVSDDGLTTTTTITNTATKEWQVIKVNSNDVNQKLPGAIFELVKQVAQEDGSVSETVVYTGHSQDNGVISWDGINTSKSIAAGEYILREQTAPEGYARSETEWKVVIAYQGALPDITINGDDETTVSLTENNGIYECKFGNAMLYELPSTGGIGIYWYMIGGVLLMMAGTLILYKNKRVRGC